MENRDRDKLSKNTGSTPAGDVNKKTSSEIESRRDESGSEFGKNIGRSEDLTEESGRRAPTGDEGMSGEGRSSGSTGEVSRNDMESNKNRESGSEERNKQH